MDLKETFLAYRKPGGQLQYYREVPESDLTFHFCDFNTDRYLKLPMERKPLPDPPDFNFIDGQKEVSKTDQIDLLERTITELRKGAVDKVVITRVKHSSIEIDPLKLLRGLDREYPKAAVYLFSHPKCGTWLGASPENLLEFNQGELKTASLAGTQKWELRDRFSAKERREQSIVTQDILDVLQEIPGVHKVKQSKVDIIKAGSLAHLYTEIKASLDEFESIPSVLSKLHPTPAVGGRPRQWALDYIARSEPFDRRFYTGFFGWTNEKKQSAQFWVNLRCAEYLNEHSLAIYVGGGITAESNAEEEWLETEAKAQTILKVLD